MTQSTTRSRQTAGLFDIRNIIGALLATYGVILLATGLVADPDPDKTGGINANLWAGLVLLVVGAGFLAWARVRPVAVPDDVEPADGDGPPPGH